MKEFILRAWREADAESVAAAANNPNIAKNLRNTFPYPYSLEDARWYVNDCISNEGKNQITRAIEVDGKAVGSIGIFVKDDVYEKSAELGYWLSEDYWFQARHTCCAGRLSQHLISSVYLHHLLNVMQAQEAFWKRQALHMRVR